MVNFRQVAIRHLISVKGPWGELSEPATSSPSVPTAVDSCRIRDGRRTGVRLFRPEYRVEFGERRFGGDWGDFGERAIKIWEDGKAGALATLKPHGGQPVNSAKFLTAPHQAGHIILVTAGPLNKEVKIWSSASEEGWLLPGDVESWKCTQTLAFRSSVEAQVEEAFFNQTVALSQAGLLLFANAKKNAIYSVHLDYGANPMATRMDYIGEFAVTMPILSFTGTTEPPGGHMVKLYCVQTLAIQQYALDLCQCLPPPTESVEDSDSGVSRDASIADLNGSRLGAFPFPNSAFKPSYSEVASARYPLRSTSLEAAALPENMTSNTDSNPISLARTTSDTNIFCMASPPLPLSPRLSRKLSGLGNAKNSSELGPSLGEHGGSQSIIDYSVDRQMDTIHANVSGVASYDNDAKNEEKKIATKDISRVLNPSIMFKHPTHLITPSEILMSASSSETTNIIEGKDEEEANIQDVVVNSDVANAEVEVKEVGETRAAHGDEFGSYGETQNHVPENREKLFCSQASDLGIKMARESSAISAENHFVEEVQEVDGAGLTAQLSRPSVSGESEAQDSTKDVNGKVSGSAVTTIFAQSGTPSAKGKKQTGSNSQVPDHSSSVPNSAGSFREPGRNSALTSAQADSSQIATMQSTLNQLMTMQKELQKQMLSVVTLPVTKEGRRLEASLGRGIEKAVKASTDALWARFQEENGKNEKLSRDRSQQITNLITNLINKDLTPVVEKAVKRELAAVGPAIVRTISPSIEKTISSTITESFQRGVSDKAVNMLDRSVNTRLEATVGRQIQAQFQTSGKIALQDALKSGVEASVFPAFEKSCKAIFEQVDATFQKGMAEHSTAALQHFESAHSPLALALRDSITSTSSLAQTLSGELADVQRKLISLAAAGGNPSVVHPLIPQLSNGPLHVLRDKVESSLDPAKELSRLISERKYEEAFIVALQRSDVSIVSWLCSQVDLHGILATVPLPLSQGVLLSLLQQLAVDINNDTHRKLAWLTDVAAAINPTDPVITMHAQPIFDQVYQRLHHQRNSPTITGAELSSIRLLMHVINSMMMTCKPQ
ncbi:enhancer of mRNA-decapping protein 4-like [Pistacia vera]|uniref:enhancer of mRNA-decapping protein 4-like n=1 Tax=Pistacia vera TaxID=55513 RepID=UPI001262EEB4|nr:enhancer of mRNA-decapping protein 4-like [Pistacia vera]